MGIQAVHALLHTEFLTFISFAVCVLYVQGSLEEQNWLNIYYIYDFYILRFFLRFGDFKISISKDPDLSWFFLRQMI